MLCLFFSHGLAMFPLADSLAIVAKFAQKWHDIFKCFVRIGCTRGQTYDPEVISGVYNHAHISRVITQPG